MKQGEAWRPAASAGCQSPAGSFVSRRAALLGGSALAVGGLALALGGRARAAQPVRVGVLRYGTIAWELEVMRRHGLDPGIVATEYAASQATQVALQGGAVDIIVQDWLWVARQRAAGADFVVAPTSAGVGALVCGRQTAFKSLADLAGHRLGIAGTPLDKSWIILRAYGRKAFGIDLDTAVEKSFGPPPLLAEQLAAGRLDAALTYWPFAARAEAAGLPRLLTVEEAMAGLGIAVGAPAVGYVFSQRWAESNGPVLDAFLTGAATARRLLREQDDAWPALAPLMGAASEAERSRLEAWYRRSVITAFGPADEAAAGRFYDVLAGIGGEALVGPAPHLPAGTFRLSAAAP